MTDRILSDDHSPPNPHSALLGTLQSREPGDPELRVSTDAPPTIYERQPSDPDPAGATLVDMTLNDIARMNATTLGGQNGIADSGIDLMSRAPIEWPKSATEDDSHQAPDSEHTNSLVDVGMGASEKLSEDGVPINALVGIAEQVIRTCVADALRAWPDDIATFMLRPKREASSSETPLSVLYQAILTSLRDKRIDSAVVWPLVRRLTHQALESMLAKVFRQEE